MHEECKVTGWCLCVVLSLWLGLGWAGAGAALLLYQKTSPSSPSCSSMWAPAAAQGAAHASGSAGPK